ncbi:hypothetical protein [Amycolatopsis kentuckyensis]|uniref:hypothetical protein n=1 Tax=Amycolatopsis kentuckyensis TaxID=218823 RepID=UPI0035635437
MRREIADGLRWVARDRNLRSLAVFSAVANVALTGYQAIQVVFFVQEVGVPPGAVGVLVAAPGAGGVAVGAAVVAANVLAAGFRQTYPPPGVRGRVVATSSLLANGSSAAGALLAGALGSLAGPRAAVWAVMAVLVAATGIAAAGPIRTGRDLPAAATEPARQA